MQSEKLSLLTAEKLIRKILLKFDLTALRIVAIYFVLGLLWIFFSDSALAFLVPEPDKFKQYGIYKGWFYVTFITLLLYFLISRTLKEKTATERSLHASEDRWKFALEGAGDGVWDWNMDTDEVFRSARWKEIYGYSSEEMNTTATHGRSLIHPEDIARALADNQAYLEGKKDNYVSEFRLRCKDGSWKWTLSRGMVIRRAPDGRPLRMIGTHTDISERKHSEAQVFHLAHYDQVTNLANRILF